MGVTNMLDNESYERLKKLSDSDFRALILRIAEAAGADAQKTAAMIASSTVDTGYSLRRTSCPSTSVSCSRV